MPYSDPLKASSYPLSFSERRIIGYDGKTVTIGYAHREKREKPCFTLPLQLFIGRLLSHVPEKGTHVVRAYGLFHPRCREKLNLARKHLGQGAYVPTLQTPDAIEILAQRPTTSINI